jgi:hypothetical protein
MPPEGMSDDERPPTQSSLSRRTDLVAQGLLVHSGDLGHMRRPAGHFLLRPTANFTKLSCDGNATGFVRALKLLSNVRAT